MAQMNSNVNIPIADLTKSMTGNVSITGLNRWKVKLWIGTNLIKLAAYIMGMNVEINVNE